MDFEYRIFSVGTTLRRFALLLEVLAVAAVALGIYNNVRLYQAAQAVTTDASELYELLALLDQESARDLQTLQASIVVEAGLSLMGRALRNALVFALSATFCRAAALALEGITHRQPRRRPRDDEPLFEIPASHTPLYPDRKGYTTRIHRGVGVKSPEPAFPIIT